MVTKGHAIKLDEPEVTFIKPVKIVNVNMPFWAMVGLFIKAYFAFLVASLFLALLSGVAWLIFGGIIAAMLHR
jgi:hypothetical protein